MAPKSIRDLSLEFKDGSSSPVRATEEALSSIEGPGSRFNCFITVLRDSAVGQAKESEARWRGGRPLGPLDGVPIAVKDLFYIKGVRCTAGSRILSDNVAPYDSPVVRKLKDAGAVLVGTTNMHEFAAGITGENPHYGPVRNPWNEGRISGGSSSGSAAAVCAGLVAGALGTDTAGSVRTPAALCGVVGFKPTYGRISRLGVIPLASSFDTVGTLTNTAWDAAALLSAIAGHQPDDLTTVASDVPDYLSELGDPGKVKAGVPKRYFHDSVEPGVEAVFDRFLDRIRGLGWEVKDEEIKGVEKAADCWKTIRYTESTAFHLRWLESSPEAYGEDVRLSLERGKRISAVDYVSAQNLRPLLMQDFAASFEDRDVMVVPCTAVTAPEIGQREVEVSGKTVDVRSALIDFTLPFNVVGFPVISVPAGLSEGLPVGVQLVSRPFDEAKLLRLAAALEGSAGHLSPPSIV